MKQSDVDMLDELTARALKAFKFPPYEGVAKEIVVSPFDHSTGWLVTTEGKYLFAFKDGEVTYLKPIERPVATP